MSNCSGQEEGYEEIQGEIEMLQQCNHPNVVRYFASYQSISGSLLFHDFVTKCLTKDPRRRRTATEMLKVEYLKIDMIGGKSVVLMCGALLATTLPFATSTLKSTLSQGLWGFSIFFTGICSVVRSFPLEEQEDFVSQLVRFLNEGGQFPQSFKDMLNNPSERAADVVELFTLFVLNLLGYSPVPASRLDDGIKDHDLFPQSTLFFGFVLSESCFVRKLAERYKSIGDVPVVQLPELQMKEESRRALSQRDDGWREPAANWLKWFTRTIHERIFPSESYTEFEAKVNYLTVSLCHDVLDSLTNLSSLLLRCMCLISRNL
ncbi:hypothetical protein J5N97_008416 [Dioscorea zingiberensis]|uniref:Protein kinase domain-containing protein n=1 Tax=Dioscorea zingiberensis TaxID=325984 RepID=A0A9D5HL04_9LILI|nr:hypothetical protein J5N97_008416 [Dioscorea zingiberensis]